MFSVVFEVHPKDDKRDSYMGYANSSDTETTSGTQRANRRHKMSSYFQNNGNIG